MANFLSTPTFIVIELEITKLGGGHNDILII